MRAKVVLLARVKTPDDKYPFVPVEIKRKQPVIVENTMGYYLRYSENGKRVVQPVGPNIEQAFVAYQNKEMAFARSRNGLLPIETAATAESMHRVSIADAVASFIAKMTSDVEKGKMASATMTVYRNAAESLRDHSSVTFMDEITADVLLKHENWLHKNIVRRTGGHFENTLANRFRYLNVFLRANGIKMSKDSKAGPDDPGLLDRKDVPKGKDITNEEKVHGVRTYKRDDIKAMLDVANEDEADLIHFALKTGFREGEIATAEWSDIDWTGKIRQEGPKDVLIPNTVTGPKPVSNWLPKGFRTKNGKSRKVEIPLLIARLKAREKRAKKAGANTTLIFPNGGGMVNTHLVKIIQAVAKRAEKKGHKINGKIGLHRFRKTYGTYMLSATDIQTVSMLLGHTGDNAITTTMRYLGVDRGKAVTGSKVAFKGFGD